MYCRLLSPSWRRRLNWLWTSALFNFTENSRIKRRLSVFHEVILFSKEINRLTNPFNMRLLSISANRSTVITRSYLQIHQSIFRSVTYHRLRNVWGFPPCPWSWNDYIGIDHCGGFFLSNYLCPIHFRSHRRSHLCQMMALFPSSRFYAVILS